MNIAIPIAHPLSAAIALSLTDATLALFGASPPPPWTPADLFGDDEPGVWGSASDLTDEKLLWRRNLRTFTTDLLNTAWQKTNCTVTVGTQSDSFIMTAEADNANVFQSASGATNVVHINSIEVRRVSGTGSFQLNTPGGGGAPTPITSEWSRKTTSGATGGPVSQLAVVLGTSGDAVEIRFPQTEVGSTATEYQPIPTTFDAAFLAAFPKHALFQLSNGTVPLTGIEQNAGLILDKRLGGPSAYALDDEFTDLTGWSAIGGASISLVAGGMRIDAAAGTTGSGARFEVSPTPQDTWYEYEIDVSGISPTARLTALFTSGGGAGAGALVTQTVGTLRLISYAPASGAPDMMRLDLFVRDGPSGGNANPGDYVTVSAVRMRQTAGNHLSQPTAAARPRWSARKNRLLATENLPDAVWVKNGVIVSGSTVDEGFTTEPHFINQPLMQAAGDGVEVTASVDLVGLTGQFAQVVLSDNGNRWATAVLDLATGVVTETAISINISIVAAVTPITDGWRLSMSSKITGSGTIAFISIGTVPVGVGNVFTAGARVSFTGAGKTIAVNKVQVEFGPTATRYQRVVTATDYDPIGFPKYFLTDGVDDGVVTTVNIIDATTDKVSTIVGAMCLNTTVWPEIWTIGTNGNWSTAPNALGCHLSMGNPTTHYHGDNPPHRYTGTPNAVASGVPFILASKAELNAVSGNGLPYSAIFGTVNPSVSAIGVNNTGFFNSAPLAIAGPPRQGGSTVLSGSIYEFVQIFRVITEEEMFNTVGFISNATEVPVP